VFGFVEDGYAVPLSFILYGIDENIEEFIIYDK
jgi:hypothetical protein